MPRARMAVRPEWKPSVLTEREMQVVGLIQEAWTNKEIAAELGISEETVKRHLCNMFDKLGCFNRTELAVRTLGTDFVKQNLLARRQELVATLASIDARLGENNEDATEG